MVFTPNKNLEQPARGSNVGVWDTPVNSNTGIIDNSFGGTANIVLGGSNITLSPSQYQCVFLNFTGILTANVAVIFPVVGSFYTVENNTTGNFIVYLATTFAGPQYICAPPGEAIDIKVDGNTGDVKFRNLGRIGSYLQFCNGTVPTWITNCQIPPYLYCNGAAFSAVTYPVLAGMIGTTLPDFRGRTMFDLDGGTGRLVNVINGNVLYSAGGIDYSQLTDKTYLPSYGLDVIVTDPTHSHTLTGQMSPEFIGGGTARTIFINSGQTSVANSGTGISVVVGSGGSATPFGNVPPGIVGGYTMIRAG